MAIEENGVPEVGGEAVVPTLAAGGGKPSGWLKIFMGEDGLRPGWSIGFVIGCMTLVGLLISVVMIAWQKIAHVPKGSHEAFGPVSALVGEVILCVLLYGALVLSSLIERKKLSRYNFAGPKRWTHLVVGTVAGFATVSAMIGSLYAGHWLQFGGVANSGAALLGFAAEWGLAFLLVGFFEEGMFRCFLLHQFTRGLNFWIAFGIQAVMCGLLMAFSHGNGVWGVYVIALLGLVPCFVVHQRKLASSSFWQAAWVSSAMFGAIHTGNGGENWIGIFSAAAIGFVFCVTVKLTGSVWWAIGFHAAWDWGLTCFYGAADSGAPAVGNFLKCSPLGDPLWSGGADGPEGSLLIVPLMVVLLVALYVAYGRRKNELTPVAEESAA